MNTPNRYDRVLLDDDAFDDFRSCTHETIVFDDGGACLQRFEHSADAHAARRGCTFLPIWAHEPTVAQVSIIVPSST